MAWRLRYEPDFYAFLRRAPYEVDQAAIMATVESWADTGPPPEAVTRLVAGYMLHEFSMPDGVLIKFHTEEDGEGGGEIIASHIIFRHWTRPDLPT